MEYRLTSGHEPLVTSPCRYAAPLTNENKPDFRWRNFME